MKSTGSSQKGRSSGPLGFQLSYHRSSCLSRLILHLHRTQGCSCRPESTHSGSRGDAHHDFHHQESGAPSGGEESRAAVVEAVQTIVP